MHAESTDPGGGAVAINSAWRRHAQLRGAILAELSWPQGNYRFRLLLSFFAVFFRHHRSPRQHRYAAKRKKAQMQSLGLGCVTPELPTPGSIARIGMRANAATSSAAGPSVSGRGLRPPVSRVIRSLRSTHGSRTQSDLDGIEPSKSRGWSYPVPPDWMSQGNEFGKDLDARIAAGEFSGDAGSTKEQLTRPLRRVLAADPLGIGRSCAGDCRIRWRQLTMAGAGTDGTQAATAIPALNCCCLQS
jgi:hypothetical protein